MQLFYKAFVFLSTVLRLAEELLTHTHVTLRVMSSAVKEANHVFLF